MHRSHPRRSACFTRALYLCSILEIYQPDEKVDPGVPKTQKYTGSRTIDGIEVLADGRRLDERYDLKRFTSMGFEWTYEGAEPRQLALAILADHLGDDQAAFRLYEPFMREVVANLENDWDLTGGDIDAALKRLEVDA